MDGPNQFKKVKGAAPKVGGDKIHYGEGTLGTMRKQVIGHLHGREENKKGDLESGGEDFMKTNSNMKDAKGIKKKRRPEKGG